MSSMNAKNLLQFENIMMTLQDLNTDDSPHADAFIRAMERQVKREIAATTQTHAACEVTRAQEHHH